jgi:hypothetical protein
MTKPPGGPGGCLNSGRSDDLKIQSESGETGIAEIELDTTALRRASARQTERFLKGPIPMRNIAAAARLPG